jgi:hypothetical protein
MGYVTLPYPVSEMYIRWRVTCGATERSARRAFARASLKRMFKGKTIRIELVGQGDNRSMNSFVVDDFRLLIET